MNARLAILHPRRESEAPPASPSSVPPAWYLQPGELLASREPMAIKTLLGSCVSVCLWDSVARIGGLNHFLLPYGKAGCDRPGRYGNLAMRLLIDELLRLGARGECLTAKVFGGAAMFPRPQARHIGVQNLDVALSCLAKARIQVVASDVGGAHGRKLEFHTSDGSVDLWEL